MCTVRECIRLEDSLSSNDQKVRFYIGLPSFAVLISVFNLVSSVYSHTNKFALSKFNCYTHKATSLSVRLDLAYRFGVSQPMISRIFIDGLTWCLLGWNHWLNGITEKIYTKLCHWILEQTSRNECSNNWLLWNLLWEALHPES